MCRADVVAGVDYEVDEELGCGVDPVGSSGVGPYGRREYPPTGQPERFNVHDFPDKDLGKAIPYGIYDVLDNTAADQLTLHVAG